MPFTVCSGLLRLNWPWLIVSVLTAAFNRHQWDINGMLVCNCLALISFSPLVLSLSPPLFVSSHPPSPSSSLRSPWQRDSREVWFPGGRHGPIQHLQLPALCRSLHLRAGGWMGRDSESQQRADSLAQRRCAHLSVQRPLWAQRDEENAGR